MNLLAFISIHYYYLGSFKILGFVSYLVSLFVSINSSKIRMPKILFAFFVLYSTLYIVASTDKIYALASLRLYFGMFLLIPLFYYVKETYMDKLFLSIIVLAVGEKILLLLNPDLIFHFPNYFRDAGITFSTNQASSLMGGMHAFGGNRTVSGMLFLAIGLYFHARKNNYQKYAKYAYTVSLLCWSSTAMLLSVVILLFAKLREINSGTIMLSIIASLFIIIASLILGFIFLQTSDQSVFIERFSYTYLEFIWYYKGRQIVDYLELLTYTSLIIGTSTPPLSSTLLQPGAFFGDFILLDLLTRHGVLGIFLLGLSFCYFFKGRYIVPVVVMLIGSLHYHVLFSMPGQIIFAYLFCQSRKEAS